MTDSYYKTIIHRGIRNNNPFNIRKGQNWQGEKRIQTDSQFEQFETMTMGIRAGLKLIKNHIEGLTSTHKRYDTLATLIGRWAPPSENQTWHYIDFVATETGISPFSILEFKDRERILAVAKAMTFVECGQRIPDEFFDNAYQMLTT